jgi:hypothetical protein
MPECVILVLEGRKGVITKVDKGRFKTKGEKNV